jgi:hypothetical protein
MKKTIALLLLIIVLFSGCGAPAVQEDYGSFTLSKTYCYNEEYYAKTTSFKNDDGAQMTVVDIYLATNDVIKCSIVTDAESEFWGFCWEKDSYNIWIQTSKGISCYKKGNYEWTIDETAQKPDYIVEKSK